MAATALLGARLVAGADDTISIWAASSDIQAGSRIDADQLEAVRVRFSGPAQDRYVPSSDQLAGNTATRPIAAGELIPRAATSAGGAQRIELPLSVPNGQFPTDLAAGDRVDVWIAPASNAANAGRPAVKVWQDVTVASLDGGKAESGGAGLNRQIVIVLSSQQESALGPALANAASGQPYLVRRGR